MKLGGTIINLAHTLNFSVIVEGVETQEQLEFLRSASCDEIEGYFFSAPLPADEFEKLLQNATGKKSMDA